MATILELPISEGLQRKLKTLLMLAGTDAQTLEELVSDLIDRGVSQEILKHLGMQDETLPARIITQPATAGTRSEIEAFADATGISDGLGDDDDEKPVKTRKKRKKAPQPEYAAEDPYLGGEDAEGATTDEEMDEDMRVNDPSHEAKVDAATFADSLSNDARPEDLFSEMAGLPEVPEDPRAARRIQNRRRTEEAQQAEAPRPAPQRLRRGKATVSAMTEEPRETL